MVNFKKRLGKGEIAKPIDPVAIYETLDRTSDKGELRRIQAEVLTTWHNQFRKKNDVVLKLHTGQGKTLIGLLILQSKLNEGANSAVYLCPNNYLIDQTCIQAKQFGIRFCTIESEIPSEFLDGKSVLITSVQKMFNGKSKFRLGHQSLSVDALLMDDCHACIDAIRDAFTIKFNKGESCYEQLLNLFSASLESQGAGSFAEIKNGNSDSVLAVPYWDWQDKQGEIVDILARMNEAESKKTFKDGKYPARHGFWFVWPLLKDSLQDCFCVFAGSGVEIVPRVLPLDVFGSFSGAAHRVFMSATVTDDSFLIKGLKLSADTILNPLISQKERWSGEKMVLIPSLIHDSLDRTTVAPEFAVKRPGRDYGVVVLTPNFAGSIDWERYGARVAKKDTILDEIERLKNTSCDQTLIIVNRYDGIDLPDDTCRVLVFDSKPFSENLVERYEERCRPNSVLTIVRTARTIEQGLGRSVRGEKDYSAILIIGPELVRMIRSKTYRQFFSRQTQAQIEIGLEIAELAKEEAVGQITPLESLNDLIKQCLVRDEGWKAFYVEKMDAIAQGARSVKDTLEIYKAELNAELTFQNGDPQGAISIIQKLIDGRVVTDDADIGWYLQEMARYALKIGRAFSNDLQLNAHKKNKFLLRPSSGMLVSQLLVSVGRMGNIIQWIKSPGSYEELNNAVQDILTSLQFGVKADRFEGAFDELGKAMGFNTERPDKQWKEGPDNLWGLEVGHFLLVECKSGVDLDRAEIVKDESGQMNNACAWFAKNYPGCKSTNIIIIPPKNVSKGAGFNEKTLIMREKELRAFNRKIKDFFLEFSTLDLNSLTEARVQELVNLHHLSINNIVADYGVEPRG